MKPLILALLFPITFISFSYSQSNATIANDMIAFLPAGKHIVKLFGPALPDLTPREKELQSKAMKAMKENAVWFRDSSRQADMGKMLEKMGLTPEELEEYGKINQKGGGIRMIGSDSMEIIRTGNIISFQGNGSIGPLDSLKIDLEGNKAFFGGQPIPFKEKVVSKDDNNPFKSALTGYQYSYDPLPDMSVGTMHVMDNSVMFTLMVGKLETTGETVFSLMAMKYVNVRLVLNVNMLLMFK